MAQLYTNRNIAGLKTGNREAAVTFTVQNSLQEIVNIVFAVETRLTRNRITGKELPGIKDSLTLIGYNASVLGKLTMDTLSRKMFQRLNEQVGGLSAISYGLMGAVEKGDMKQAAVFTDSLKQLNLSDGIYNTAVKITKQLEERLQNTLEHNAVSSRNLSAFNKILALIAIAAILILATIIINRHLRQLQLIVDLEKANRQVKKSALIKEQFLANMSHEIRTPLNAIKGFSGLMLQTDLKSEQKQYAGIIENASNNLLEIVNDVLDISKIEAGKLNLENKDFNIKDILQMLEFMFFNSAIEKNLEYKWRIAKDTPLEFKGDADRLNQILINLISNAIKFTPYGHVAITVQEVKRSGNRCWLQINVEDSGIGIDEDKLDQVFERFYQIAGNDTAIKKGTGLGLAIVKNLALLMGGDVKVESHTGQGSVFTVTLPFEINHEEGKRKAEEDYSLLTDLQFKGVKLLVAEDNTVNQLLVKYLLKKYGIDPSFRKNGMEVIEALLQEPYDLLLLDIQMPVMNGFQTIEKMKELRLQLPVVAMTAFVMPGDREKCLAAGMDDYFTKPINEAQLQKVLIKYLHGKRITEGQANRVINGDFLLNLSGGDKEMANTVLKEMKNELGSELLKLEGFISQNMPAEELRAFCHHLISTISPLGSDTLAMKTIKTLQQQLNTNTATGNIQEMLAELKYELEKIQQQGLIV
jgi:signal transduction histidine kinase/CheY-like chemotaxis protein